LLNDGLITEKGKRLKVKGKRQTLRRLRFEVGGNRSRKLKA
jgi:hypothetical protein